MTEPLVSICVITYNSSKTVVETLESIKNQSYSNIELVVSDDCSPDNTVEIVQQWLEQNKSCFIRTELITVEKNTGVTGNVNRGLKVCQGKYVKDIAGDDALLPNYVQECVAYLEEHPEIHVLFTRVKFIDGKGHEVIRTDVNYDYFSLEAHEQFQFIINHGVPSIPTPSIIYRNEVFSTVGYFDERIPMWEDGPMYFILTKNNIRLYLLDKVLIHNGVLSNSLSNAAPFRHRRSIALFFYYYLLKYEITRKPIKALYHCFKFFMLYHSDKKICQRILAVLEKRKTS
ncbi:MAG: glycosyltransferase [Spirochaetaceae bacterium]|nr:glycosyltransferase [Spirochaetaceae bacterium]